MKLSFQKDWKLSSGRNQPRRSLKMFDVAFAAKNFLFLLLLIPGLSVWYYFRQRHRESDIRFSSLGPFAEVMSTRKERARHLPFILRLIAIALLVLALDISSSMLAEDFQPNRIEAAKNVAQDFISGRTNDRIALVIFSSESFTKCPLKVDY